MRHARIDTGISHGRIPAPRRSARLAIDAEVVVRRPGRDKYKVRVYDVSEHGCRLEFVERPKLDERAWVKFEGLEALEVMVCWIDGHVAGVEFERPIYPAVFAILSAGWTGNDEADEAKKKA